MAKYNEQLQEIIATTIRTNIREAGTKLIRERGWEAFTTENVAQELGVSRSVLYNYFKNKEDIIKFILKNSIDEILGKLDEIVAQDSDVVTKLNAMAELFVNDFCNQRELHKAIRENLPMHNLHKDRKMPPRFELDKPFKKVIDMGIASGEFRECNSAIAAMFFVGVLRGLCDRILLAQESYDIKEMIAIFLKGIAK